MKSIVIYQSHYGTTKQYAQWIAEAVGAKLMEQSEVQPEQLRQYDTIIYGGGIYAGGILGLELIANNMDWLQGKKVVVFSVGLCDPSHPETIATISSSVRKSFGDEGMKQIQLFHLRGAMDYSQLHIAHQMMMAMLQRNISKQPRAKWNETSRQIIDTYGQVAKYVDKESIHLITEFAINK